MNWITGITFTFLTIIMTGCAIQQNHEPHNSIESKVEREQRLHLEKQAEIRNTEAQCKASPVVLSNLTKEPERRRYFLTPGVECFSKKEKLPLKTEVGFHLKEEKSSENRPLEEQNTAGSGSLKVTLANEKLHKKNIQPDIRSRANQFTNTSMKENDCLVTAAQGIYVRSEQGEPLYYLPPGVKLTNCHILENDQLPKSISSDRTLKKLVWASGGWQGRSVLFARKFVQ